MSWIDEYLNDYYKWIKDNTFVKSDEITGWSVITTPFLSQFNDPIEIYAKKEEGKIYLSDDGETLRNLELYGINLNRSDKKKKLLSKILFNYGIYLKEKEKELISIATKSEFPQKKHNLLSAIIEINDMQNFNSNSVINLFKDDVKDFLNDKQILNTPKFIASGSTGINYTFDFLLPKFDKEIIIKTMNSLNTSNVPTFLYSWEDVKENRKKESDKDLKGLAIINDKQECKTEFLEAIKSKGADYILWSQINKKENIQKLTA